MFRHCQWEESSHMTSNWNVSHVNFILMSFVIQKVIAYPCYINIIQIELHINSDETNSFTSVGTHTHTHTYFGLFRICKCWLKAFDGIKSTDLLFSKIIFNTFIIPFEAIGFSMRISSVNFGQLFHGHDKQGVFVCKLMRKLAD